MRAPRRLCHLSRSWKLLPTAARTAWVASLWELAWWLPSCGARSGDGQGPPADLAFDAPVRRRFWIMHTQWHPLHLVQVTYGITSTSPPQTPFSRRRATNTPSLV